VRRVERKLGRGLSLRHKPGYDLVVERCPTGWGFDAGPGI
jgi:hypothetical protein